MLKQLNEYKKTCINKMLKHIDVIQTIMKTLDEFKHSVYTYVYTVKMNEKYW